MGKFLSSALVVYSHALIRAGIDATLKRELGIVEVVQLESLAPLHRYLQSSRDWMILVIDPSVEGCGGIKGIARLRRTYPWLRIAVISDACGRDMILRVLGAGAHGFVSTDSSMEEIVLTFRAAIEGHIHVPDDIADITNALTSRQPNPDDQVNSDLTERQRDVVRLMSQGYSNKEIGRALHIAESTVKVHVSGVFKALGVKNRVSAVAALEGMPLFRH